VAHWEQNIRGDIFRGSIPPHPSNNKITIFLEKPLQIRLGEAMPKKKEII